MKTDRLTTFRNSQIIRVRRKDKMVKLVDKHFRLTEEQYKHLTALSAMTGYNVNELLRLIVDNVDDGTMKIVVQSQQEKANREMKVLARQKYLINLFSNVTNNINQIAKYVNEKQGIDESVVKAFSQMTTQVEKLRGDVREHFKGN